MKARFKATFEYIYEIDTRKFSHSIKTIEDLENYFKENKEEVEELLISNFQYCEEEELISFEVEELKNK